MKNFACGCGALKIYFSDRSKMKNASLKTNSKRVGLRGVTPLVEKIDTLRKGNPTPSRIFDLVHLFELISKTNEQN